MAIRPWVLKALETPAPPPQEPGSGWTDYIKSAVMAPLHVLGSGYKGIGTVASSLDSAIRTGDLFAGFKLNPEDREGSLLDDAASAFGFGDTVQGTRSPFGVAADAVRSGFGGQRAEAVDPEWEAAFRRAAPITTGIEAAGTLAGEFGTQAVLDPVGHGLAALGTRGTLGASQALRAAEKAPTYNVLPEAISRAVPGLSQVSQGTIPKRILSMSPEAAARGAHALGAAFVPGMALSAAENLSRAPEAIAEQTAEHGLAGLVSAPVVESAGQGLVDAAFAGLGAYHALRGRPKPPDGPPNTGESLREVQEAQAQGNAEATPVKRAYEAPGIAWRRKSYEDLLSLSPEEQARLEDLNGLEPSPEMLLALEGKAPEIASPETSVPSLEDAFRARAGEAPDMSFEGFVDIPGELAVKPTYEDVLRRAREEVAAQPTMPAQSAPELGVPLPPGATEVLRVPLHEVAAADLRGREGKRGARPQNQEQLAADAVFAEAEKIANEINKSGGTGPEVTVADVIEGRAPIQITGPKKLGGGLRLDTPEQKRNALAAIAARIADNAESNRGIDNQALREGVDNGRLAEMLEAKLAAKGMRPSRSVLTPDREIAEHDAIAGEAGFPDDTLTATRQEDPLAGAAERMAALRARKAAEAAALEDPFERKLREAAERAQNRPTPETTVVESPRLTREPPEPSAAPVEPAPTTPKDSGGGVVRPELWKDTEGEFIEGDWKVSPEQATRANELGLDQDTAELLSKPLAEFEDAITDASPVAKVHLSQLYRKFNKSVIVTGQPVEGKLPWDRGEEARPAEPVIRPQEQLLPDPAVKQTTAEEAAERKRLQEEAALRSRYTTVQTKKTEPRLGGDVGPFRGTIEPSSLMSGKGPSLLEKMAARAKAAELGEEEKASIGPSATEGAPVKALLTRIQSDWKGVIRKADALDDGGVRLHFPDGRRVELHPSGEIIAHGPDVAGREGEIRGAFKTIGRDGYIRLVEGKADFVSLLHEFGHDAFFAQLSPSEKRVLFEKYAGQIRKELGFDARRMDARQRRAAEEVVVEELAKKANAYLEEARRTGVAPKAAPGWFKRLWDYITRVVRAFKSPEFEALARDFAEGKIYDRSGAERFARKVGERLRGEGAEATNGGERYSAATAGARSSAELEAARKAWKEKGTESPWFKRWFGESKAVDAEGKPLLLYHGTAKDFNTFETVTRGPNASAVDDWAGAYFASDQATANGIARFEARLRGGQARTEAAYVSLKNPAEAGQYRTRAEAEAAGHDGRITRDTTGRITEVLVFSPEQIKSAIGNRGTFDSADPDIRYQRAKGSGDARTTLDKAREAYEAALAASRGLRGPAEKAASARVREARKALKLAEEGVRASEAPLDADRPPLDIAGHAPKDPAAGAEGPVSPTQVSLKQARVQAWRKELGKAPFDWASNVPQSHRSLIPKAEHILETETPEQIFAKRAPDPAREMAKDAFLRGRQADMEVLQAKRAKILEEGGDTGEVNAEALLAGLDLQIAELTQIAEKFGIKDVEYATALARTLSVRNVIMSAGRSLPDTFLRDLFKKHPNISAEKANALAEMVRDGKFEDLPEALFAAVEPGAWPKFLEWWKAGLVSAPGTLGVANPAGNVGEGIARLAEGPFAVLTDAVVAKATGRARERTFGEVGAEARAASAAVPEAWRSFKDDFSKILKGDYGSLLELDEGARKKGLHELLQYPPAIGAGPKWAQRLLPNGNVGKTVRTPLYILSATDAMFRKIGQAAELGKLSYREAVRELGANAGKKALALKAQEIEAIAKEPGSAYEHILRKAEEAARERVFQAETPALRSVKSLRANVRPLGIPIGHLAVPFLDTPFNIFKIMIERSPAGSLGAARAWKKFEIAKRDGKPIVEVEALRDKAIDLTARAALGTAMFSLFYGAAKAGLMTGAGPTDPKSKKALMETGWQPYSFKIGDTYIPFNRFEPVSSILGFSADAHEIANKSEKENVVKKTAAAFMTNALSKTYLQGLSDAAGLIVDPERYGPEYAASLAGSVVPNVVAKAAQAIDPVMRETRPPDGGALGRVKATVQSRIPGASMLLPEQRTLTGEVRERPNAGSIAGAVSRFALPLQVTRRKAGSEIQEEFARIGFTPPVPDRKMRVSGQEIVLATTELPKLGEEYKKATARAERLMRSPAYRGAPDEAGPGERSKRKLLDRLYDEANERFKARYASVLRARARAKAAQPRANV